VPVIKLHEGGRHTQFPRQRRWYMSCRPTPAAHCGHLLRLCRSAEGVGFEPTRKLTPPSGFQDPSCNPPDLERCGCRGLFGRVFGTTWRASDLSGGAGALGDRACPGEPSAPPPAWAKPRLNGVQAYHQSLPGCGKGEPRRIPADISHQLGLLTVPPSVTFVSSGLERFLPARLEAQGALSTNRWTFRAATCSIGLYWFLPPQAQRGPARASRRWRHQFALNVVTDFASRGHVFTVISGYVARRMGQLVRAVLADGRTWLYDAQNADGAWLFAVQRCGDFAGAAIRAVDGGQPGRPGDRPAAGPRRRAPRRRRLLPDLIRAPFRTAPARAAAEHVSRAAARRVQPVLEPRLVLACLGAGRSLRRRVQPVLRCPRPVRAGHARLAMVGPAIPGRRPGQPADQLDGRGR
jgi:hypothetical protein